jgi:hypothetical protein
MDLEQLEVQRSGPARRNPVMPALLAGIHNQDEMFVAIHFDRDTPSGRALRAMGQSSIGGGHRRRQSPVGCGHQNTIGGAYLYYKTPDPLMNAKSDFSEEFQCSCVKSWNDSASDAAQRSRDRVADKVPTLAEVRLALVGLLEGN